MFTPSTAYPRRISRSRVSASATAGDSEEFVACSKITARKTRSKSAGAGEPASRSRARIALMRSAPDFGDGFATDSSIYAVLRVTPRIYQCDFPGWRKPPQGVSGGRRLRGLLCQQGIRLSSGEIILELKAARQIHRNVMTASRELRSPSRPADHSLGQVNRLDQARIVTGSP